MSIRSSPIAVSDSFHFSHYNWKSWDLSTGEQSEAEYSDTEGEILTPNPVKHEDIKLKFYNSVLGDDSNNIHFGKWDNIAPDQPDAYGNASQAMTDYMFQLALDLQLHRNDDFTYVDLGSGTAASAISIAERYPQVARAACLNLCHEQNISASHSIQQLNLEDRVEIVEGTFEDSPFPDATFDLAFSQDAFIHAVSKKKTYEEAYRVTKAGGAFVFCDLMAGDEMDLTQEEQQKFTESNVLNDWLTPAENVQVCRNAGWKQVEFVDLTTDMRISFQLMLKKVNYILEHTHAHISNMSRVLLMNYSKKIKERLVQIDRGVFKWAVIHARKPVQLNLACKPPVPFINTSDLILEKKEQEDTSIVVVDILHKMPREKIEKLPKSVSLLITLSAGLDHIDTAACAERGIVVKQSGRDAITSHVVEYALAFIILGLRDALNQSGLPFPSSGWDLNWNCEGIPLTNAKIAIIGMGTIATQLVSRIRAIAPDTDILYHVPDVFRDTDTEQIYKLQFYSDLEKMASECDILVPMCPLTKQTEHIVSKEIISKLKPSAGLLNVARGKVVDTDALVQALETKAIKYAILDTTFPEPLPKDHKLWKMENCHIFPHYATNTMAVRKSLVEDIQPIIEEHYGLGYSDEKLKKMEKQLRFDLAVAHQLTASMNLDMLVWNHISARFKSGCLITPGRMLWKQVKPQDLVYSSSNVTADIIHQAIYESRSDIQAIIHLHTPAATAVSCLEDGFVPLTQDSAYFYGKVANYEWDGVSDDSSEGPKITQAIRANPGCNTLLMQNHGSVCFGRSVREAWVLAYYFERCCEVQLRVMQTGAKIKMPTPGVMKKEAEASYLPEFAPGVCEWDALCKEVSFE